MKKNSRMMPQRGANRVLEQMNRIQRDNTLLKAAHKSFLVLGCMVLHDKFGFGEKRLKKFIEEFFKQADAYGSGHVESVSDFEKVLEEECNIIIKF